MENTTYPRIRNLIQDNLLPEQLSSFEDGIKNLLDPLFYDELFVGIDQGEAGTSFVLNIISAKLLGFEIPGTGLLLALNPQHSGQSSFPVWCKVNPGILRHLKKFNLSAFSFEPDAFFILIQQITSVSEKELIMFCVSAFVEPEHPQEPLDEFAQKLNSDYGLNIPVPVNSDINIALDDIISEITGNALSVQYVVFQSYILDQTSLPSTIENINALYRVITGEDIVQRIKDDLIPHISAGLTLSPAIIFPRNILQPMKLVNGVYVVEEDEEIKTVISLATSTLWFDSKFGIGIDKEISASFTQPYDRAQIGNSGFSIGFTNLKLDLSKTSSLPEILAAGYPPDFMGVFIEYADIGLPSFLQSDENIPSGQQAQIIGQNLIIGTGGFSGKIILDDSGNQLGLRLGSQGGFSLSFESFTATFHQNAITESSIHGSMVIPGFTNAQDEPAHINIDAYIGTNGEFCITASENQGIQALYIKDILNVTIKSLSVGRKGQRWFVAVSGDIAFEEQANFIGQFIPDSIEVQKLLIWQDGEIEFEGGTLVLPEAITLKLPPVELSITALGMGTHRQIHQGVERRYRFFEFSGGINVNPGGVDARGDGIKFFFTTDDAETGLNRHVFVRIQGIYIDLEISAGDPKKVVLLLEGYLAMKNPQPCKIIPITCFKPIQLRA